MHSSNAETLAVKALGYLASEGDALLRFLEASGLTPDDLRARACDPELLAAVMDFLLSDDVLAGRFAAAESVDSALLHAARRTLPGGIADQGS